jgi:uncharacterized repeat protein (TIGR01451 family)
MRLLSAPRLSRALLIVAAGLTAAVPETGFAQVASPTISTQIAVTGSLAPGLGFTTLGDTATLAGFGGTVTGETVTFKLYGPFGTGVTPVCSGVPSFTTTGTLNVSGVATTSGSLVPTTAGTYVWVASYPGDGSNNAASGSCTDANESVTIVASTVSVSKAANPTGPVLPGSTVGFDLTVSNPGTVPATGVTLTDNLPAGADLNWSLNPSNAACSITGAVGSQILSCAFGTVAGGTSLTVIHVQSATTTSDCAAVQNKATVATTNGTGGQSNQASVNVSCGLLSLTKKADSVDVSAGAPIGFTVTASNDSLAPATATGVVLDDPLPGAPGLDWSIASGPGNCSILGSAPSQTLHCTAFSLAKGASVSVHVTSPTTCGSDVGFLDNTATLTSTNSASPPPASDSTIVYCLPVLVFKTADAASVPAGSAIGFTVEVFNDTSGIEALLVSLTDALPGGNAGNPVHWTIDASTGDPSAFSITGADGSQQLKLAGQPITLAIAGTLTVHVTAATSIANCGVYANTAHVTHATDATASASAQTVVDCTPHVAEIPMLSSGMLLGLMVLVGVAGWLVLTRH